MHTNGCCSYKSSRFSPNSVHNRPVKVKCTLVQALRLCTGRTAHRESRGIALPFLDHGTRRGWGFSVKPWPLFTPGNDAVHIVHEAGWVPGPVWTGAENIAAIGIRSPDRPTRSQSLYRLRYPAHIIFLYKTECVGNGFRSVLFPKFKIDVMANTHSAHPLLCERVGGGWLIVSHHSLHVSVNDTDPRDKACTWPTRWQAWRNNTASNNRAESLTHPRHRVVFCFLHQ